MAQEGKEPRKTMPDLWKHGLVTPLQDAFHPQGPMCKAGIFLLHSGDLSKLTTGQATSVAQHVALPLGSGAQTLWFEPRAHHAKDGKSCGVGEMHSEVPREPNRRTRSERMDILEFCPQSTALPHSPSWAGSRQETDSDQAQ